MIGWIIGGGIAVAVVVVVLCFIYLALLARGMSR